MNELNTGPNKRTECTTPWIRIHDVTPISRDVSPIEVLQFSSYMGHRRTYGRQKKLQTLCGYDSWWLSDCHLV